MTSATNERAIARAKDRQREDRLGDEAMVKTILLTPRGRRWFWLLLGDIFNESQHVEPQRLAFEKGRRDVLYPLFLKAQRYAPASFVKMLEENSGRIIESEDDRDPDADPTFN